MVEWRFDFSAQGYSHILLHPLNRNRHRLNLEPMLLAREDVRARRKLDRYLHAIVKLHVDQVPILSDLNITCLSGIDLEHHRPRNPS